MTAYKYQKQHASNYNYKGKRSFGQRLRNFFTIPEEDLKEEPSKEFEKIKLFTLTRGSLFLGILVFMILINILVGFNINFLYLRQIFGFLFLILIPGLLIMLCFKIRTVKFWEYLVYTVGLSIAFIMFAGLAVNWTLPALNITDKPLSLWPILICFDIFLLGLWLTAIYRNKDLKPFDITIPKLDTLNRIFFIIPMAFPLLSILGAFLLNNHGPNILTMIMLGGIAVYVLLLVIFRKHMNENVWPWTILMISLALLLSFSMRGEYISGWDINFEQYVFRLAYENGVWSMNSYRDAYNSCLSLNILPTIINLFLKVNSQLIFKIFMQIIFIFHSLTIFLIFRKYIKSSLAFLSSFLYFGAGYFNSIFPTLIRQEIAFIFFGLMLLVLFTKEVNVFLKKVLFLTFGASMIISHYSTTYIALTIFTLTYIFALIYRMHQNRKISKKKYFFYEKSEFYLTGILIFLLLLFGFLWMSQMTDTSEGLISTFKATYENMENIFSYDLKQSSIKGALFGGIVKTKEHYTNEDLEKYINNTRSLLEKYSTSPLQESKYYTPQVIQKEIVRSTNYYLTKIVSYFYLFVKYTLIISFILGFIIIAIVNSKRINKEFLFMIFISILFMFLMISLPYVSRAYDFERLFQQSLIFLSFSSIFFLYSLFKNKESLAMIIICIIYTIYCIFNLGFFTPLIGGFPELNLYNQGVVYNSLYIHKTEVISIDWFNKIENNNTIYIDDFSDVKLYSIGNPLINKDKKVIPSLMKSSSYVYSNYANTIKNINFLDGREISNEGPLFFNFPREFLNNDKYKIYNNGGSEIFK